MTLQEGYSVDVRNELSYNGLKVTCKNQAHLSVKGEPGCIFVKLFLTYNYTIP